MNIAMILSGGSGKRFGSSVPKQYITIDDKSSFEYALAACKAAKLIDKIVIVASADYVEEIQKKYGYETVAGGKERNNSVKFGMDYIASHYDCERVFFVDAATPLVTGDQVDKYIMLLDNYDYVLTAQKITHSLGKNDGTHVLRDDYFLLTEPESYKFGMLYKNFDGNSTDTTPFHQMPHEAKEYRCFDYPYNMKLTYPFDIKLLKVLLDEYIVKQSGKEV